MRVCLWLSARFAFVLFLHTTIFHQNFPGYISDSCTDNLHMIRSFFHQAICNEHLLSLNSLWFIAMIQADHQPYTDYADHTASSNNWWPLRFTSMLICRPYWSVMYGGKKRTLQIPCGIARYASFLEQDIQLYMSAQNKTLTTPCW